VEEADFAILTIIGRPT